MAIEPTIMLRQEELRRRVEALPKEVAAWRAVTTKEVDMDVHFSQLNAIDVLMDTYVEQQKKRLDQLTHSVAGEFPNSSLELIRLIIKSQKVWDFFRDKLDLRFSPVFKDALWIADTVAWNCHRPILELAANKGILDEAELREPPLTYLSAEFSPATWVRGGRPNDGRNYFIGTSNLPIPVIELPWDYVENFWEFVCLHHEVGHDLEADLKLRSALKKNLEDQLNDVNVDPERIKIWKEWEGEVFADLVGLQLGGPAFTESLLHLLILPKDTVTTYDPDDPHPTPYVRTLMNTAYIRTLIPAAAQGDAHAQKIEAVRRRVEEHAKAIEDIWKDLYGPQPQFDAFVEDFPRVFAALMNTKMPELKDMTVKSLIPFTAADDSRIRSAAEYLATGENAPAAGSIQPRHCVAAARLAVKLVDASAPDFRDRLAVINKRTGELVRDNAPPGLRGSDDTTPHREFIASFADNISI